MRDLTENLRNCLSKKWPLLAIFVLVAVFFYPVLFKGLVPLPLDALVGAHVPWTEVKWLGYPAGVPIKNLEISDTFSQFYPWRSLVGEYWRAGKIPLWNSYMFSGTPFLATLHSAALYPLNVFYLFLSNVNAWSGIVIFQILLSLVFMYLFLKSLNLSQWASLFGAIVFSFSGYMIGWLEFATGGHSGLWLPLLLLVESKLIKHKKVHWVLITALIFFMIYTAGDFQVPLYVTAVYFMYGLYMVFNGKNRKGLVWLVLGFVGGVLLSSLQLFPTLELYLNSVRVNDAYIKDFNFGLLDWSKILNFIWPDFFGNVVTGNYWGRFTYHEYINFTGIVSLVFTGVSIITKKVRMEKFFLAVIVLALLMAFPTPIGFLPYKFNVPGLGTSSASRIIYLIDFSLAVLASFGFSKTFSFLKKENAFGVAKRVAVFLLFLTLIMTTTLIYIWHFEKTVFIAHKLLNDVKIKIALRNMVPTTLALLSVWGLLNLDFFLKSSKKILEKYKLFLPGLMVFITVAELLRFAWKNTSYASRKFLFPTTKTIDFLKSRPKPLRIAGGIPTNLFMPFKIESIEGYDPLFPKKSAEWISAIESGEDYSASGRYGLIHNFSSPLLDYSNVEYIVDYKKGQYGEINKDGHFDLALEDSRYKQVFSEGRVGVFKNIRSLPRVWLSVNYEIINDPHEMIKTLLELPSSEKKIILSSSPDLDIGEDGLDSKVKFYDEDHNKIDIIASASENSLLFLSQSNYPGWEVFIDGEKGKILEANYKFQAVGFPEGEHKIEFVYNPKLFRLGVLLSSSTLAILVGLSFFSHLAYGSKRK